jgi:hypothetical protein
MDSPFLNKDVFENIIPVDMMYILLKTPKFRITFAASVMMVDANKILPKHTDTQRTRPQVSRTHTHTHLLKQTEAKI